MFGGATAANVSIETTRQNLPAVLRLVGEILREPSFPQSEFDQLKQETLTQIEGQKSEPTSVAITELSRHFNIYPKGHPLYAGTIDETIGDLTAVTLDDVKRFHKDFYGASSGQMSIVGDFDEKEAAAVTQEVFGGWKSANAFTRIKAEYRPIDPINLSLETPDKANAFFLARMNVKMRDDNADYPAARARKLHARRWVLKLAAGDADPAKRRTELRRRFEFFSPARLTSRDRFSRTRSTRPKTPRSSKPRSRMSLRSFPKMDSQPKRSRPQKAVGCKAGSFRGHRTASSPAA